MKEGIISPRPLYFSGLFFQIACAIFLSYLTTQRALDGDVIAAIVLTTGNTIVLLIWYFYIKRWVYLFFYVDKSIIEFGNLFFKISINSIELDSVKRLWWLKSGYLIKVGGKKYYFVSINPKLLNSIPDKSVK